MDMQCSTSLTIFAIPHLVAAIEKIKNFRFKITFMKLKYSSGEESN